MSLAETGSKIYKARKKLGLSQADVAKAAGVTQGFLSRIEAGTQEPSVAVLEKIYKAVKLTVTITSTR